MNRVKGIYRSWGIPCAGQNVYHPSILTSGWARSPKPACAAGPSFTISNWTRWFSCANKHGKNSSPRANSTRPGNCFAQFRPSVRSGRPCSWPLCKRRISSAPSECSGSTAGSQSSPRPVPISSMWTASSGDRRSQHSYADSTALTIIISKYFALVFSDGHALHRSKLLNKGIRKTEIAALH
jgi:hypothetical protein